MDYYSALKRSGKILEGYFEQSKDVLHSGSKGTIRENIINKIIRPFLPMCYGISGGEAFDKNGNVSKQLDLVVYDAVFSYLIPYMDNFIQFPCESVYGNIEIKSYLDKNEFDKAIENIASLKSLERKGTHDWTVTPLANIQINGLPNNSDRNPYFGIIFAYDSVDVSTVVNYIKELKKPSSILPNAIVLYSKHTILIQTKTGVIEPFPVNDFNGYGVLDCGDDIIAIFIGILINFVRFILLSVAEVPGIINKELQNVLDSNNKNGHAPNIMLNNAEESSRGMKLSNATEQSSV